MEAFIQKKLQKAFAQYGRDIKTDPLTKEELYTLYEIIKEEKEVNKTSEWYEIIEDIVYDYITNKI